MAIASAVDNADITILIQTTLFIIVIAVLPDLKGFV